MSNDTSCPAKYLKLRAKILQAIEARQPAGRRSLIRHLKLHYPKLWKSVSDSIPPCALRIEELFAILDLPVQEPCKGGCGKILSIKSGAGSGGLSPKAHCSSRCAAKDSQVVQRKRDSYRGRTGHDHNMQHPEGLLSWQKSYQEKTGYTNPGQNPTVIAKIESSFLKRFGHRHYMQNPIEFNKVRSSKYRIKSYTLRNGTSLYCQGYEPVVLSHIEGMESIRSITTTSGTPLLPCFSYQDPRGKHRVYNPDIGLRLTDGRRFIIEVKGPYTLDGKDSIAEVNRLKFQAAERWCSRRNGAKFVLAYIGGRNGKIQWITKEGTTENPFQ